MQKKHPKLSKNGLHFENFINVWSISTARLLIEISILKLMYLFKVLRKSSKNINMNTTMNVNMNKVKNMPIVIFKLAIKLFLVATSDTTVP